MTTISRIYSFIVILHFTAFALAFNTTVLLNNQTTTTPFGKLTTSTDVNTTFTLNNQTTSIINSTTKAIKTNNTYQSVLVKSFQLHGLELTDRLNASNVTSNSSTPVKSRWPGRMILKAPGSFNTNLLRVDDTSTLSMNQSHSTNIRISTTTQTTSTTTTTTTTKSIPKPNLFVVDFKLINSFYLFDSIQIDYLIKINTSSLTSDQNLAILFLNMNIRCTNLNNQSQTWSNQIDDIKVFKNLTHSKVSIHLKSTQNSHLFGSLIKCEANLTNKNATQNPFSHQIYLAIDPSPATNLRTNKVNQTAMELKWSNPIGIFDFLELICNLDSSLMSTSIHHNSYKHLIENKLQSHFVLGNLIPGGSYNCSLLTIREYEGKNVKKYAQSVHVIESLDMSEPKLLLKPNILNNRVSLSLQSPDGIYSHYVLELNEVGMANKQQQEPRVPSSSINITSNQSNRTFSNNQIQVTFNDKVKPGHVYEIMCKMFNTKQMKAIRLSEPFISKPMAPNNLTVLIRSPKEVVINWSKPSISSNQPNFLVNVIDLNQTELTYSIITNQTNQVIQLHSNTNQYLITVRVCAKFKFDCDTLSDQTNATFSYKKQIITHFEVQNTNFSPMSSKTSVHITWSSNSKHKDFSKYRIKCTNTKTLAQIEIYSNCTALSCALVLNNLEYNTLYNISLNAISLNGQFNYEQLTRLFHTQQTIPFETIKLTFNQSINADLPSNMLSIIEPQIDESNGNILGAYLFMVKLPINSTFILNPTDQNYLNELMYNANECSNSTEHLQPCILKTYSSYPNVQRLIYIGKYVNDTENITTDLIEAANHYQLFYVFKIDNLYYASLPTDPIEIKMNSLHAKQNALGVWLIVAISFACVSVFILIVIGVIAFILVKYKPNKFRKAVNTAVNSTNMIKTNLNDFNEFIVPGEFSRYHMTNIWLVKHANGDLILDEEYRNLPDYRDVKTTYVSQLMKNEVKNRFLDIKAYDDSRVILETDKKNESIMLSSSTNSTSTSNSQEMEFGDYINANFVQGYSHDKKFIATQGPKKETIIDFWRMISQYRVTAIVMLTKLVEKGVERCTQYWPEKPHITELYGDIEVTMKDQQKCGDYIKRTFDVLNTASPKRNYLEVTQYYYPEWPDKDTPSTDPISILHLIRDVNRNHLAYQYPIVVHCSAGVGRTGTYITLDAMMEKIEAESKIDIFGFISKIRERRQYLVQTAKQYVFIHEALYEYCLYGFTDIEISQLNAHYKYLKEISSTNANGMQWQNTTKTRMHVEFDKLCNAFSPNSLAREAFSLENKCRNRYLNTICYDENRVHLSSLNGSSYINATKLRGFECKNELIITQDPMTNTQFEFWKMIFEYDCYTIVALNKDYEKETDVYWPTEEQPVRISEFEDQKYIIQLVKQSAIDTNFKSNKFITKRHFEITEHKYSSINKMNITHFIYNEEWSEDRAPKSRDSFIELVRQVQKEAEKHEFGRVVVHAYGGGSNCSVFCALYVLSEQFRNDQFVDVCRTVKKLRAQRPHMIETYEQYEFIYECLMDFLKLFGLNRISSSSFQHSRTSSLNSNNLITKPNQIRLNLN